MSSSTTPPAAATHAYKVFSGNPEVDGASVVRVWLDGGLARYAASSEARFNWFYLDNPQGKAQLNFLHVAHSAAPIGFIGVAPRNCFLDAQPAQAGLLIDFVVKPEHRTAMPALLLQRTGRERALQSMQAIYGLPDKKAVMISKRLGGQVQFELGQFARVLRFRAYLQRHVPVIAAIPLAWVCDSLDALIMRLPLLASRNRGAWVDRFDAEFDSLWERFDKRKLCIGVRDREFLNWRFKAHPGRDYRTFAVRDGRSGALRMYFVCQREKDMLFVKDCLSEGSEAELSRGLLMLSRAARREGVTVVHVQVAGPDSIYRALRRAQFSHRGRRPFFAEIAASSSEAAKAVRWYVTQADEDV